jgi:nitrous-oxide reductase
MRLLSDSFTEPEPHYAQIIRASLLKPIEVYPKEENKNPNAVWDVAQAGMTRQGNNVTVKMVAVRSTLTPTHFEVNQGDKVTVYITNIEQTTDELHGFGLVDYNLNVVIDPGETKTVEFVADKVGVYPYYCTNFCSALHQEMQGYMLVKPRGGAASQAAAGPRPAMNQARSYVSQLR